MNVVVTGTSRGIGLAFVREYVSRGHTVVAGCRTPETAEELNELSQSSNSRLHVQTLDVTNVDSTKAFGALVSRQLTHLDVLVNNAGVFHASGGISEVSHRDLVVSFETNAIGPMVVLRELLALLEGGPGGKVVNITMPTRPIAKLSRTENHSYIASRYALNALTKMASLELEDSGVSVYALWPGYLRTDMNDMSEEATDPADAIPGLVDLIASLPHDRTGTLVMPDGTTFDW